MTSQASPAAPTAHPDTRFSAWVAGMQAARLMAGDRVGDSRCRIVRVSDDQLTAHVVWDSGRQRVIECWTSELTPDPADPITALCLREQSIPR